MESDYGNRIKTARQEKGLTLEEVSYELKINLKTLTRIEESKTEELPKAPFTRGFLKTYCTYLELASAEVLQSYEDSLDESDRTLKKGVLKDDQEGPSFFAFDFIRNRILPVGILVLIAVGAGSAYKFLNQTKTVETPEAKAFKGLNIHQEEPRVEMPEEKTSVEDVAVEEEIEEEKPRTALGLNRIETVYQGQKVKVREDLAKENVVKDETVKQLKIPKHKLVVEPLSNTSLYIKADLDEKYVRATLKPDRVRVFKFDKAQVRFLDAGAVNLIFNGEDIGALGVFGEEKRIEFPSMKEL